MRVLFINTFDSKGGAAIVAHRLKKSLTQQYGLSCYSLVAHKNLDDDSVFLIRNSFTSFFEKIVDRIFNVFGLQYQYFPFSSHKILTYARELKPDIINIHNTHGGYFQTSLLKKLSKIAPVVWTLHDMWSFTGNSAHTFGDESWKRLQNPSHLTKVPPVIGLNTGGFLLRQKKRIVAQSNVTAVTPSRWLYDLVSQSPVFSGKTIRHINNGLDLQVFRPREKNDIRLSLGIQSDDKVLMFSAEHLKGNPWKGGNDLIEILKHINEKTTGRVHLIVTGSGGNDWLWGLSNFTIHNVGYVNGEVEMARYFSASDLFLYPTRADNLPNVLVEAIACGVPCVTFNIGGCSEIIHHGRHGLVMEPAQFQEAAIETLKLLSDRERLGLYSVNARAHAEKYYSIEQMASVYQNLFQSLTLPKN